MGKVGEWEEILGKVFDNFFFTAAMEFYDDFFKDGFLGEITGERENAKTAGKIGESVFASGIESESAKGFSENEDRDFFSMLFADDGEIEKKIAVKNSAEIFDFKDVSEKERNFEREEEEEKEIFEEYEKIAELLGFRSEKEEEIKALGAEQPSELNDLFEANGDILEEKSFGEYENDSSSAKAAKMLGIEEDEFFASEKNYDDMIYASGERIGGRGLAKKIFESEAKIKGEKGCDVKIEMVNNNNVNSTSDIDDIADMLTMRIFEIMQKSADGLY